MSDTRDPVRPQIHELLLHREWIRKLARRLVADDDTADEIVQQVLVDAVRRPPETLSSPRGWLTVAVRNAARKFGRAASRRRQHEAAASQPEAAAEQRDVVAHAELQQSIGRAVLDLEEPYRTVVLLRYFDGLSAAEIAARRGVPLETVRTQLKRGLGRLRQRLDKEHGGDRAAWTAVVGAWGSEGGSGSDGRAAGEGGSPGRGGGGSRSRRAKRLAVGGIAALLVLAVSAAMWSLRDAKGGGEPSGARATDTATLPAESAGRSRAGPPVAQPAAEPVPAIAPPEQDDALPPPVDMQRVDPARDLIGRVVDVEGVPIPGATVSLAPTSAVVTTAGMAATPLVTLRSCRSARDGTFLLASAPTLDHTLVVSAPTYARTVQSGARSGRDVRIVMRKAVAIQVKVVNFDDQALAGVPVIAVDAETNQPYSTQPAVSDGDGTAWLRDLPACTRWVLRTRADAEHHGTVYRNSPASGFASALLPCIPKVRVQCVISSAASGAAVEGATVIGLREGRAVSGADGRVVLLAPPRAARGPFLVIAPGFARARVARQQDGSVRAELVPGAAVVGRVAIAGTGRPVVGAKIAVSTVPPRAEALEGVSTETGEFRVDCLEAGLPLVIQIDAEGLGRARVRAEAAGSRQLVEVGTVALAPERVLRGRLLDDLGVPVAGAAVVCTRVESAEARTPPAKDRDATSDTTDAQGRFRIAGLAAARYDVVVSRRGYKPLKIECDAEADSPEPLELRLPLGRRIAVRVIGPDGEGVEGIGVDAAGAAWDGYGLTNAEGRAQVVAAPDSVSVCAWFEPGVDLHRTDDVPIAQSGETTIRLSRGTRVFGQVVGVNGEPVPNVQLCAMRGRRLVATVAVDAEGMYMIRFDAEPGVKLVALHMPPRDGSALLGFATHEPGKRFLTIQVSPLPVDRTMRVRVTDPSGKGVVGVRVNAELVGTILRRVVKTNPDGVAEFTGLPLHELLFWAAPANGHAAPLSIAATPAGQEVHLPLRAAWTLTGSIYDARGGNRTGVVQVMQNDREVSGGETALDGTFAILVPSEFDGPFKVVATTRDGEKGHAEGVTRESGRIDVRVRPE